jgi:L-alanine-DL-glutamate epimerase-like enolase superfamily enzyme
MVEYIRWINYCFAEPIRVEDGFYMRPQRPGASTTLTQAVLDSFSKPLS